MTWSREFDDPIPLPSGKALRTLRDAAEHVQRLPKAEQSKPHWQATVEALILAAEGRGPAMHARIGMVRALRMQEPAKKG